MKRILHIGSKLTLDGGIENYVMNLYKGIDTNQYQFDFVIVDDGIPQYYESIVQNMGGIIHKVTKGSKNIFRFVIERVRIFTHYKQYGVIHIHTSCGVRVIEGIIARFSGIKYVIFHSHSNSGKVPMKYRLIQPLFRIVGSKLLACSPEAGTYFFGRKALDMNKFKVAKNAILFENFKYSVQNREALTKQLGIQSNLVVGFVGRLSIEKNLDFLLNVFYEISKINDNALLLITGDGKEKDSIIENISKLGLVDKVILLGIRKDIGSVMSVLDILLLPSVYEGMPVVLIEAQASGLKCYTSDVVSTESKISELVYYLSLKSSAKEWADTILKNGKNLSRENMEKTFNESGYSISSAVKEMTELYNNLNI